MITSSFEASDLPSIDAVRTGENTFHVLKNNKAHHAELLSVDHVSKTYTIRVNGKNYEVNIEDQYDLLVQKMGLSSVAALKIKDIKAPMPGLVLEIQVAAGQEVEKDDPLLILEAMKMENVIKAPGHGVVKKVTVKKGEAVDKNQLLIEME
jgi:biotin carboxyl carrier protein